MEVITQLVDLQLSFRDLFLVGLSGLTTATTTVAVMSAPDFDIKLRYISKLIGTYINLMLYGIELLGCYFYFASERSRRDLRIISGAVALSVAVDTVGSFASSANAFIIVLKSCSGYDGPVVDHWTIVVWIICGALTEFIVQCFMVYRYYRLSSNYIIVGIIFTLMVSSFVANVFLGGMTAKAHFNISNDHDTVAIAYKASLGTTVAADLAITAALLCKLLSTPTFNLHTRSLIRRLCAIAILTGSATSAVAIATIIAYSTSPYGNLSACFGFFLGRVYTLTMLFTLLTRDRLYSSQSHIVVTDSLQFPANCPGDRANPIATPLTTPNSANSAIVFASSPPVNSTMQQSTTTHSTGPHNHMISRNSRESIYECSCKSDHRQSPIA